MQNLPPTAEINQLRELIELQGVDPIDDLDVVSRLWPADDDPDLLYDFLMEERLERRLGATL